MNENEWTEFILANEPMFKSSQFDGRLWDRTRPDIISKDHVLEVDWSHKWKEGVGQAVFYREMTGKRGGLLLLFPEGVNSEKERLRAYRALVACKGCQIDLFLWDCEKRRMLDGWQG